MTLKQLEDALATNEKNLGFARSELDGWQKQGSKHHIEMSKKLVASFEVEGDKLRAQIKNF